MIAALLSAFRDTPSAPLCLDAATDGYFSQWEGTEPVVPDFSGMKTNREGSTP